MHKKLTFLLFMLSFASYSQDSSPLFSVFYSPIHTIGFDQTNDIGTEIFINPQKSVQFIYGFAGSSAFNNDNEKTHRFRVFIFCSF